MYKKYLIIIVFVICFVSMLGFILYYPYMVSGNIKNYFIETNQVAKESVIQYNSEEDWFELYDSQEVEGFSTVYLEELPKNLQTMMNIYEFLFVKGVVILV